MSPPEAAKIRTSRTPPRPWKLWNYVTGSAPERHEDILLSMCATDLEKELTAQQHLCPDYAQMKAHIVTVINSRTHGLAPMMMGNLSDEDSNHHANSDESVESEDGELYRLEIRNGKKVFTKFVLIQAKAKEEGKAKQTESVSAVDASVTFEQIAESNSPQWRTPNSAAKGKGVGNCEDEETETSQNVPLETIGLGSRMEDDESKTMPRLPSTLCNKWMGTNAPKIEPDVKGCLSVNFPACSVCQKLGVYQRLPVKAPQYDISSEGETDRATTPMMESAALTRWT